ncbi:hypothetical protein J7E29_16700 [Streptomyces sp. ISL-90]|nr:hypothetical protein [Streptomyces sp. ISL-90]
MARKDLSTLIGRIDETKPAQQQAAPSTPAATPAKEPAATVAPTGTTTRTPRSTSTKPKATREPKPEVEGEPLYLRLERKETRLRSDQISDLNTHARRLNRAKGPAGERITENTLIRVAVDLLLAQADRLAGGDETELRNSVTLEVGASR